MRLHRLSLALLALTASTALSQTGEVIRHLDGKTMSTQDAEALARTKLAEANVTGAEIAVINHGRLVWSTAFGLRRKDPPLPMDKETTTWAASITKAVFATYFMHLVESGEFGLDTPLAKQLDKPLNEYDAYKETAADLVKDPDWSLVTPRMLLSHTAGLLNFATQEPDKKIHLHSRPGTQFNYSGEGINLVQFAVEQKYHKPLDELMQEALFTPLGMTRTGIIYRKEFEADVADRYDVNGKFRSQTKRFPARAAGSMTTSAEDLAKFAIALLDNKILRPSTRAQMFKPVLYLTSQHQFPLRTDESNNNKEAENVGLAYGVGWGLLTDTRYGPAFFKEGHGDGAQNYMICFEKQKSCMILLTNSDNGELAFRPLLETILGDTFTPWEWEGYTPSYIEQSRKNP